MRGGVTHQSMDLILAQARADRQGILDPYATQGTAPADPGPVHDGATAGQ
jgi:hypothetical protein